jgi:hypothetical protein
MRFTVFYDFTTRPAKIRAMTLDELEREYVSLRQQADAVRSYL